MRALCNCTDLQSSIAFSDVCSLVTALSSEMYVNYSIDWQSSSTFGPISNTVEVIYDGKCDKIMWAQVLWSRSIFKKVHRPGRFHVISNTANAIFIKTYIFLEMHLLHFKYCRRLRVFIFWLRYFTQVTLGTFSRGTFFCFFKILEFGLFVAFLWPFWCCFCLVGPIPYILCMSKLIGCR
jgi:hypothetical protein